MSIMELARPFSSALLIICLACLVLRANGKQFFHLGHQFDTEESVSCSNVNNIKGLPKEHWFTQRLDHFDAAEIRTWRQRYFINDKFYKPGGPVFLLIEGEGTANPVWCVDGQPIKYAEEFGALFFQVEHRYYGFSHPTSDMSVKNLQYLSSEQALADLANFRTNIGEAYGVQNAKWIFFGGSYSGSLAAWMRLKYPHLVYASVASSAPLLAKIDFEEYLGVVEDDLANVSATCNSSISAAVDQIDGLLGDKEGWSTLTEKFKLCSDLDGTNENDVTNLYSTLAGNFEGVAQYNNDNRAFEGAKATNITLDILCDIMDDETIGAEIDRYAAVNSLILEAYSGKCLTYKYKAMIDLMRLTGWKSNTGARQWTYQTCTEFGFYQSSDLPGQPFGPKFPIDFWVKQCAAIFGPKFSQTLLEQGVNQTNMIYGGLGLQVTRVLFPNGSVDPWHALGATADLSADAKAVYIQGTAHCADMYPDSPLDPPELLEARETIKQTIASWLSE